MVSAEAGLPLISCVMPTTGSRREFIAPAIRTFLAQDYPAKELIIVDEPRPAAPLEHDAQGPHVHLVTLDTYLCASIGAKRNLGIALARGDLICLWDDDDYFGPQRLRRQAAPILAGEASISGLYMSLLLRTRDMTLWSPSRAVHAALFGAGVRCGTLMFRRERWDASPFPNQSQGEDAAFLTAQVAHGQKVARITDPASYICVRHGDNITDEPDGIEPPDWKRVPLENYLSDAEQRFYRTAESVVRVGGAVAVTAAPVEAM